MFSAQASFAQPHTPFLRNGWYAAAYAAELGAQPLARTLLDLPVVLYRAQAGDLVAMEDRCPHRFAPLSGGTVVGNAIQCPYHGLRFGPNGACTHNPHYDSLPSAANIRVFPLIERHGLLWIWPGDPTRADPALLPDFSFLDRPGYRTVSGYLHVKANYQLIVDNLLDLSHVPYLHPEFAPTDSQGDAILRETKTELIRHADCVISRRWRPNSPPNAPTRVLFGFQQERMDSRSHMHWFPPALLFFDLGSAPVGGKEEDGLCLPALHAITPETALTSHYFFAQARNLLCGDTAIDAQLLALLDHAFRTQDEPMIEAQQARMANATDIMALNPILLRTDAASMAARRLLAGLIDAEHTVQP